MNCQICQRETPDVFLEKHHLIPHVKKGKETIDVCCDCGDQIHKLFSIQELKYSFNTLESLLANDKIKKWVNWIRLKNQFGFCMKSKKKK